MVVSQVRLSRSWLQVSQPDLIFARHRHAARRAPPVSARGEGGGLRGMGKWKKRRERGGSNLIWLCVVRYSRTKSTRSCAPTHACMDGMEAGKTARDGIPTLGYIGRHGYSSDGAPESGALGSSEREDGSDSASWAKTGAALPLPDPTCGLRDRVRLAESRAVLPLLSFCRQRALPAREPGCLPGLHARASYLP